MRRLTLVAILAACAGCGSPQSEVQKDAAARLGADRDRIEVATRRFATQSFPFENYLSGEYMVARADSTLLLYSSKAEFIGEVDLRADGLYVGRRLLDDGETIESTLRGTHQGFERIFTDIVGVDGIERVYREFPVYQVRGTFFAPDTPYTGLFGSEGEHILDDARSPGQYFVVRKRFFDGDGALLREEGELFDIAKDYRQSFEEYDRYGPVNREEYALVDPEQ
ncbi:MAG: hypothetical protein ABIH41_01895 [Nanoarchaeota archaeon]